jgi:uncharacterized protein YdcH (DUF465 family)
MADAQLSYNDGVPQGPAQTDEEYRQLVTEHHDLDQRIRQFSSLAYLTDAQRYEETALKKRKLALKDRIEAIRRGVPMPGLSMPGQ